MIYVQKSNYLIFITKKFHNRIDTELHKSRPTLYTFLFVEYVHCTLLICRLKNSERSLRTLVSLKLKNEKERNKNCSVHYWFFSKIMAWISNTNWFYFIFSRCVRTSGPSAMSCSMFWKWMISKHQIWKIRGEPSVKSQKTW